MGKCTKCGGQAKYRLCLDCWKKEQGKKGDGGFVSIKEIIPKACSGCIHLIANKGHAFCMKKKCDKWKEKKGDDDGAEEEEEEVEA